MSDGFMMWCLSGSPTVHVIDQLAATGADFAYPIGEGEISVLDLEGTQSLVSRETFMSLLEDDLAPTLTFQTWYSRTEDIVVTIRRNLSTPTGTTYFTVTCYLDGLETDQLESAVSGTDELLSGSPEETLGIVIDRRGATEDFDWEAFIGGPNMVPPTPDRLVVRQAELEKRLPDLNQWSTAEPAPGFATLTGNTDRPNPW